MTEPFINVKVAEADGARIIRRLARMNVLTSDVIKHSLNDTAKTGKVKSSTEIRKDIAPRPEGETTKQYIDRRLKIRTAKDGDLNAWIAAEKRGLLLSRFGARYVKSRGGVTVKIKPSGARKLIAGAFIVKNLKYSGATGVAIKDRTKRSGIKVLYGASVSQVLEQELENLQRIMSPIAAKRFKREASALVRGVGRYARQ